MRRDHFARHHPAVACGAHPGPAALPGAATRHWSRSTAISAILVGALSAAAQAADVTSQAEFDAAIQQAITTGQPNTINVQSPTAISAGAGLVLPGQASPLALNFNLAPQFGVGYATVGNLTIGAGTNITFAPTTGFARFRVGVDPGGNGTMTMTGGSITSVETPGNYLVFDIGRNTGVGTVNQSGGTLNMANGALQIGVESGQGTYNLSGTGAVTIGTGTVYFGDAVGGVGVLHISDSASFTTAAQMYVGNDGASGTITQDGGPRRSPSTPPMRRLGTGAGALVKAGAGTLLLSGLNTYSGGTTLNAGIVQANADSGLGAITGGLTFNGGTLQYLAGFASTRAITLNAGGGTFDTNGNNATLAGGISGQADSPRPAPAFSRWPERAATPVRPRSTPAR